MNIIVKDLNIHIKSLRYHLIKAIKQLSIGNIAIFNVNNNTIDKL